MSGIPRRLAQQLCFTAYLVERDCLSAAFSRMGSGFTPHTVLSDARHHLDNIQSLMMKMERIAPLPQETIVAKDYQQLIQRNCCGRD